MDAIARTTRSSDRRLVLALTILCAACDSTAPGRSLTGLWGGRHAYVTTTDSLVLALNQFGTQVRGFGILRRSDDPRRTYEWFGVQGTVSGRSVELYISLVPQRVMRATLDDESMSGSVDFGPEPTAVTVTRFAPSGGDVAGTWALATRQAPPPEDTRSVRDTIVLFSDGRLRRARDEQTSAYGTLGLWFHRDGWLILEQLVGDRFDSLHIEPSALVRTRIGFGGVEVVETFARVSTTPELE